RVAASADKAGATLRARYASGSLTPWQTGLTKETSASIRKMSDTVKRRWSAGELRTWTQGKTRATDERIAATAEKIKEASFLKHDEVIRRVGALEGGYSVVDVTEFAGVNAQFTFRHDVCGTVITRCFKGFV